MITSSTTRRNGGSTKRAHKQLPKHTVHSCVAVIGLPSHDFQAGGDGEQAAEGVGKSCLCSRFVLPSHDDYTATEEHHPSVVSQEEFNDPEINAVHYLYFGTVLKVLGPRTVVFHIVEQTTFTDSAGSAHAGGETYAQRSTAQTLRCPNKISYIGARFKGIAPKAREKFPKQFDRRSGPDGGVKGYVLVVDPTLSAEILGQQISLLESTAEDLDQARLPYVIALTKCDQCSAAQKANAVARISQSAALCGGAVFETSARTGVGVDEAFFHLHCQIAQKRNRGSGGGGNIAFDQQAAESLLGFAYRDAAGAQWLARVRAVNQVTGLLSSTLDDSRLTWSTFLENIGRSEAVAALITLNGMEFCRALFKQHLLRLHLSQQQGDAAADVQDLVSDHADFVHDEKPLDVDVFLKPLSQERWGVRSNEEEEEEEEAYANSGEEVSSRTTVHADFYFSSAVADVFGQVRPPALEDLHELRFSVTSGGSGDEFVPPGNDAPGAEDAGLKAEADNSSVADCYYIIGPSYHGGVQKSKHLLRQLSRQYTAKSLDGDYIDLVNDPFTIEEASDSSDDETDCFERSVESDERGSPQPLECSTEDTTSRSKSATLRSGLSTLKSALRGKASKTTTMLSFGRKKSKEPKASIGGGAIDLLAKAVAPVHPALVVTSPEEPDGEVVGGDADATEQPLELLYETGEELEVYESVVDVSSSLSNSSGEATPSAIRPSASSIEVEYEEEDDDDVYSSVTPLQSTKTSPHSAKRPNTSLTESQHSQRSSSSGQATSPPASRSLPPVPLPPASFETTGGVVINRSALSPSPIDFEAPPALPARNSTSATSLPLLSPSPAAKATSPPLPPSNAVKTMPAKPKQAPTKPSRPPPARPPAKADVPEQQGTRSRTPPVEEILYEDAAEAAGGHNPPSAVEHQTSVFSQYEAEEEDVYEMMESVPNEPAGGRHEEEPVNEYVLQYTPRPSPPLPPQNDDLVDSSDIYDDVLVPDSEGSRLAVAAAPPAAVAVPTTSSADNSAGNVSSEKKTRLERANARDGSGSEPSQPPTAAQSKAPPSLPRSPPSVPSKPHPKVAAKPTPAVSPKPHATSSSKPPPTLPSKPAPALPSKTPPPLPDSALPTLPTREHAPSKLAPYLRRTSPVPASTRQGSPPLPGEPPSATSLRVSSQPSGEGSSIHDLLAAAAAGANEDDAALYEMPGDVPPTSEPESKSPVPSAALEKSRPVRPPAPAPALLKARSMSISSETAPTESGSKRLNFSSSLETASESIEDCEYEVPVELQKSSANAGGDDENSHIAVEASASADTADKNKKKTKGRFGGLKTAIVKKVPKKR